MNELVLHSSMLFYPNEYYDHFGARVREANIRNRIRTLIAAANTNIIAFTNLNQVNNVILPEVLSLMNDLQYIASQYINRRNDCRNAIINISSQITALIEKESDQVRRLQNEIASLRSQIPAQCPTAPPYEYDEKHE